MSDQAAETTPPEPVVRERHGRVELVRINREAARNAIDGPTTRALDSTFDELTEDQDVWAVVLTGTGERAFSAGMDLKAFVSGDAGIRSSENGFAGLTRRHFPKPLIAAVNGPAGGAGMSLALAADFTMVAESVKMTLGYSRAGLTPDGSSTYFLPRLVGPKRALELAVTSRVLSAREALELGLVTRVIADDRLMAEAEALAAELANGPTNAYGGIKRLLLMSGTNTLEEQLDYESSTVARMARTHDGPEGISAFVQKRAPRFSGE
jgi:2-(1,2-epoxy-1,2-dihydrophenyl)acetyl-CoA isomerase